MNYDSSSASDTLVKNQLQIQIGTRLFFRHSSPWRNPVSYLRWPVALVEGPRFHFHLTIRYRDSLVLAKMFGPAFDDKIFYIAAWSGGVFV